MTSTTHHPSFQRNPVVPQMYWSPDSITNSDTPKHINHSYTHDIPTHVNPFTWNQSTETPNVNTLRTTHQSPQPWLFLLTPPATMSHLQPSQLRPSLSHWQSPRGCDASKRSVNNHRGSKARSVMISSLRDIPVTFNPTADWSTQSLKDSSSQVHALQQTNNYNGTFYPFAILHTNESCKFEDIKEDHPKFRTTNNILSADKLQFTHAYQSLQIVGGNFGKSASSEKSKASPAAVAKRFCVICRKGLSHESSYRRHMLKHTDVMFTCEFCGKVFKRSDSVRRHERKHHPRQ